MAKKGAVLDYRISEFDEGATCELEGEVSGSARKPYSVYVKLDLEAQRVLDYDCTCPAHANYMGMCKHAVALALAYLRDYPAIAKADRKGDASHQPNLQDDVVAAAYAKLAAAIGMQASSTGGGSAAPSPSPSEPKKRRTVVVRPTSRAVTLLMNASAEMAQLEAESAVRASEAARVPVEPADLSCTIVKLDDPYGGNRFGGFDDRYELRLRVRRGKASYVVKRIDELVDAWANGATVEYGKKLTLVHARGAFTERAAALLDMVSDIERAQRALYWSRSQYWYAGNGTSTKALPLTSRDAISVLDLMQGEEVVYESEGRYAKKTRTVRVTRGNPHLEFSLASAQGGGWDLFVPADADYIRCDNDLYVVEGACAWRCEDEYARRAATLLEALLPAGDEPFHIAEGDVAVFCERVLPMLEAQVGFDTPDELAEYVPPDAEFSFRIGVAEGCITCAATVSYDGAPIPLFEDMAPGQPVRDVSRELAAQQVVRAYFPNGFVSSPDYSGKRAASGYGVVPPKRVPAGLGNGPGGLPWFPEDDVEALYWLISEGVPALSAMGEVLLSERLRDMEVRQAPEVRVGASVSNGLLDLTIDASGLDPADLVRYLSSYRRKQRYVRLSSGDIMRLGDGVQALSELADGLGVADADLLGADGTGGRLPANRTLFVDALMKDAPGIRFNRDEGFRAIVRAFDTVADSDFIEPDELRGVLRGYQRIGFKWLSTLNALGFGGILADDMGLGKTVQVIALLAAQHQAGVELPSLVVCPASLVYNWLAEIERFAPELRAVAVAGAASERKRVIAAAVGQAVGEAAEEAQRGKRAANGSAEPLPDVLVTSYDLMKRDISAYASADFDIVVLDEAHYIKNPATQSAKAAKRLPGRIRFALTGTPIENRLSELWSIFDFLMPGMLGSHESFSRRFEKPIAAGEEGAADRLRSLVTPFILRRLKGEVLTDLPEKNESIVYAAMEGEQDKLYKANADRLALELSKQMPEEFAANRIAVLAELTRLRQICCDPRLAYENYDGASAKLDTCMELVSSAVEAGHSVLLFSQFTSMLDLIAERLGRAKVGYLMLTGSTSKERRVRLVRDFQAGAAPVFLISLKAGGVGINLTAADIVIHYDPWWNLAAQNQATDRAHRIGQTRDVSVFKLIAKGTIEEKIVAMQEAKRDLAESVIGGAGASSTALTRDDILALLDL